MRVLSKFLISMTTFLLVLSRIFAWNHISHYSMGKDLGYSHEMSGNMNLPDAWPYITWTYGIPDLFCWSHAVQRTGRIWGAPKIPKVDIEECGVTPPLLTFLKSYINCL